MVPLAAAGGQATSHRDREMTMAPGRGKIRDSNQDEGPLHLGLHHRATSGQQDKAADVPCRLSKKIVGRRGQGDRILNPRPQVIVPTGGQDGAQTGAMKTNRRLDSRTRLDNNGVEVATPVVKLDATQASIERILSSLRRRQPPLMVVSSAVSRDAIALAMRHVSSHWIPEV